MAQKKKPEKRSEGPSIPTRLPRGTPPPTTALDLAAVEVQPATASRCWQARRPLDPAGGANIGQFSRSPGPRESYSDVILRWRRG